MTRSACTSQDNTNIYKQPYSDILVQRVRLRCLKVSDERLLIFIECVSGATDSKSGLSHFKNDNKYRIQDVGQLMRQRRRH